MTAMDFRSKKYVNPLRCTADYLLKHEYFSVSFFPANFRKDLTFICRKLYCEQFNPEHMTPDVREFYSKHGQPTHYEFIGQVEEVIDKR